MNLALAQQFLVEENASSAFIDLLPHLWKKLPDGVDFESDVWNLLAWHDRPGNKATFNVNFSGFANNELKLTIKLYVLHKRLTSTIHAGTAKAIVAGLVHLDKTIKVKPLSALSNGDFYETERNVAKELKGTAPFRTAGYLQTFGTWLSSRFHYRISYRNALKNVVQHGGKATEDAKADKLIDTRVLGDLLAKNADEDISDKDKFYLSALAIMVAAGFRINELATLPRDCVVEDDDFRIRYFPEKRYRLGTRFIAKGMVPAVKQAISHIINITEPGRKCASVLLNKGSEETNIDWLRVICDVGAFRYFTSKFIEDWLSNAKHDLYNKSGAWSDARQTYIDVLGAIARNDGNKSATSRELGIDRNTLYRLERQQLAVMSGRLLVDTARGNERSNWDTDTRVISIMALEKHAGITLTQDVREAVRDLIDGAQKLQLKGGKPQSVERDPLIEDMFRFKVTPVIRDEKNAPVLWPHEALFTTLRNQLSEICDTVHNQYTLITDRGLSRWLAGESRSRGTKNHEDSCFERLGIVDPDTGEIAKFTSHDIRHWLTTIYAQGGLSNQLLSLIFNRDPNSNHIYDQTPTESRVEILRKAIEEGRTFGHMEETYRRLLAEDSRAVAEEYLRSSTLMATIMPHGMCTLNWMMTPCPHNLSCLAAHEQEQQGPCNHLHVDLEDGKQVEELDRLKQDAEHVVSMLPHNAPQHQHFTTIKVNVESILNRRCGKEKG